MRALRVLGARCAVPLACALAACGPQNGDGARPGARAPVKPTAGSGIELVEAPERPPIGMVAREGDPRAAIALAVAHDFGAEASVALADLVATRLGRSGFADTQTRAHGLGFVLATLVASPAEATRFVQAASAALAQAVAANESAPAVKPRAKLPLWRGKVDAATAQCSGELGTLTPNAAPPDAATLERWRKQTHTRDAVAFSAVGPRAVLDAAAGAIASGAAWPTSAGPNDAWPTADLVGVEADSGGDRRLSIAYRIEDPARAATAARVLGQSGSPLALRLGSLDHAWSVERVVATARPRGACLRVDVRGPRAEPPPRLIDVARAASVIDEEGELTLEGRPPDAWTLDQAVLEPGDPRASAAVAAWRALTGRLPGAARRRIVSYLGRASEANGSAGAELERALADLGAARKKHTVERRTRIESGQGELWALLASTCGTAVENADDAGSAALLLRALAARRSAFASVTIEPWTASDGAGLIAHSGRLGPNESPADQARRVGEALGRAIGATRLAGTELSEARTDLANEIGPASQRGFGILLEAASGGHPSWLDPRGTWKSVSSVASNVLESRRRTLVREPLRLAVIAPGNGDQAAELSRALERWLRPQRSEAHACAAPVKSAPRTGELSVEIVDPAEGRAYVAVPIAGDEDGPSRAAESTVYLLNRSGGWLEQALGPLASRTSARASVLGGKHAAALIVELRNADAELAAGVAQVRGLFERLAKGAAGEPDAALARRQLAKLDTDRALDPRYRLLALWRGAKAPAGVDLASLRRFHQTLTNSQVVVYAKPRE